MVFSCCFRASRIPDRPEQSVETVLLDKAFVWPLLRAERPLVLPVTATLLEEANEPPFHVAIDLAELERGVSRPKVVAPAAQDRVQVPDDFPDVLEPGPPAAVRQLPDPVTDALQSLLRRPPEKVRTALEMGPYDP